MNVACIGTGFVGVVTAAVLAKLGNNVVGLDIDANKIEKLKKGEVPFFEPGLSELLVSTQKSTNLSFTTNYGIALKDAEIVMLMVGTPSTPDGSADLSYLTSAVTELAPHLCPGAVVVIKSTVPPGTNAQIQSLLESKTTTPFILASVPEFLREGSAVEDTLHPDRIVIGADDKGAIEKLTALHSPLTSNILIMSPESAQMVKYAANNYLATRITFINAIADLCEHNAADVESVIEGIGADRRIGNHYWYPGLGYGGSCFPKDVAELSHYARSVGESDSLFITINQLNHARINKKLSSFDAAVGGFANKTVAVLGLSFKKNTNDTREAPALTIIPWLLKAGATVRATDPQAIEVARPQLAESVIYAKSALDAATGADILILLVEWDEYTNLDLAALKKVMSPNPIFIDTRNQYAPNIISQVGFKYYGIGR